VTVSDGAELTLATGNIIKCGQSSALTTESESSTELPACEQ